jgi:drug/metabolite transporter (DMT)-like permease
LSHQLLVVVALSLVAAALFAEGAILQQRAVRRHAGPAGAGAGSPLLRRGVVGRLRRDPRWRLGWCAQTVGFIVQAAALQLGSTAVVQPLMVTQLLFTLVLATAGTHRYPGTWDWSGGIAVCAGLVVLLAVEGAVPTTGTPDRPRLVLGTVLVCAAAAALLAAAARSWARSSAQSWADSPARGSPVLPATLLATAAGLFTSLSAALTKMTTFDLVNLGVPGTARDWPGYLLAATTAMALVLSQVSYALGTVGVSMTAQTITGPIGGYLLGVFAFHATPPAGPASLAGVAVAGTLVVGGVVLLARSPNVTGSLPGAAAPALPRAARA